MPWLLASPRHHHDIDYVKQVSPGLLRGRISTIYGISVWRNDIKCKYMFMFPLKNLARKELIKYCPFTSEVFFIYATVKQSLSKSFSRAHYDVTVIYNAYTKYTTQFVWDIQTLLPSGICHQPCMSYVTLTGTVLCTLGKRCSHKIHFLHTCR